MWRLSCVAVYRWRWWLFVEAQWPTYHRWRCSAAPTRRHQAAPRPPSAVHTATGTWRHRWRQRQDGGRLAAAAGGRELYVESVHHSRIFQRRRSTDQGLVGRVSFDDVYAKDIKFFLLRTALQGVSHVSYPNLFVAPCGVGALLFPPCPSFPPFYFSLSFIGFTYLLLLSIPSLSTRIVPLRFQAGGRRRRPNLA